MEKITEHKRLAQLRMTNPERDTKIADAIESAISDLEQGKHFGTNLDIIRLNRMQDFLQGYLDEYKQGGED